MDGYHISWDSDWGEILEYIRGTMLVIQQVNNVTTCVHLVWKTILQMVIILNSTTHGMHASIGCNTLEVF